MIADHYLNALAPKLMLKFNLWYELLTDKIRWDLYKGIEEKVLCLHD
jgi:hypothetical protein